MNDPSQGNHPSLPVPVVSSTPHQHHHQHHHQVTLLIENPRKSTNWGPLLRCCAAFGIGQIFVIGYDTCSVQGSHGASKHVELVAFHTMETAVSTLREWGFSLLGLLQGVPDAVTPQPVHKVMVANQELVMVQSLTDNGEIPSSSSISSTTCTIEEFPLSSVPLHHRPFTHSTCLVVGKRATGLPLRLAQVCDALVHIPTLGRLTGPASAGGSGNSSSWLSMEASVSIVLHEFALWAGYGTPSHKGDGAAAGPGHTYQGQKYHVQPKQRGNPQERHEIQEQRKAQRELDSNNNMDALQSWGNMFDPNPTHNNSDY